MTRFYQRQFLDDGAINPLHKPNTRKRKSGKGKPRIAKFERGEFIAWDGEGVTDATGKHRYTMLVNSNGFHAVSSTGLSTAQCLLALCEQAEQRSRAIHVAFGASYDVNMILSDCTTDQIARVWAGEWVTVCGAFKVNYRARKSFSIRRIGHKKQRLVLWDVFGFFQSSFVEALKKYLPGQYAITVANIQAHKQIRSTFTTNETNDILEYCQQECAMLVKLMETLREHLKTANLAVQRWDGAGACAAALLKRESMADHKAAFTPDDVLYAAQYAYAGGRTELMRYGHAPHTPIYHYDINSAYPSAMRECPSLAHMKWRHWRKGPVSSDASTFMLCHVWWKFEPGAMAYPFFWRAHDTAVYYPAQGQAWCWLPEVEAAQYALDHGVIAGEFGVMDTWFLEGNFTYPFQWIDTLYTQRAEWKRAGVGAEKALKLAINSLYGKTAQHVGGRGDDKPRYHCLEWAGYITSRTRATLYKALCDTQRNTSGISKRRANNTVMLATDAIYSLVPLGVPCGTDLGQWSFEQHDGITVVQSGVYWTDNNGKAKSFCRGFDKGSLNRDAIVEAWRNDKLTYDASLTRFITMGSALANRRNFRQNWQQWRTAPRALALIPTGTKRAPIDTQKPANGLAWTLPAIPAAQLVGQSVSAPYPLPWDDVSGIRDQTFFDGTMRAPLAIVEQEHYDSEL